MEDTFVTEENFVEGVKYMFSWVEGKLPVDARMCLKQLHDKYPEWRTDFVEQDLKIKDVPNWSEDVLVYYKDHLIGVGSNLRRAKNLASEASSETAIRRCIIYLPK